VNWMALSRHWGEVAEELDRARAIVLPDTSTSWSYRAIDDLLQDFVQMARSQARAAARMARRDAISTARGELEMARAVVRLTLAISQWTRAWENPGLMLSWPNCSNGERPERTCAILPRDSGAQSVRAELHGPRSCRDGLESNR
jgi:hypothetical protein